MTGNLLVCVHRGNSGLRPIGRNVEGTARFKWLMARRRDNNEEDAVPYWTDRFGSTQDKLRDAVQ
jgi:hypothetical protein